VILVNDIVRIVFAKFKEDALGNPKKLVLSVGVIHVKGAEVDKGNSNNPEEGEGVELEVGEKGETQHVEEVLVFRTYVLVV
jgi:hypothetical protein